MDTQGLLLNRRSIRKYLKNPVAPELIKKIMTAAAWAPSSSNSQPWRFYVATGQKRDELIQTMAKIPVPDGPSGEKRDGLLQAMEKAHAPSVEAFDEMMLHTVEEGLGLLKAEDDSEVTKKKLSKDYSIFARYGSIRFYNAPVAIVVAKQQKSGSLIDIGAAVENLVIAAQAEGLGTCWLNIPLRFRAFRDKIREVLDIPEDEDLVTCVCLGHPDKVTLINKMARSRLPHDQTVHYL